MGGSHGGTAIFSIVPGLVPTLAPLVQRRVYTLSDDGAQLLLAQRLGSHDRRQPPACQTPECWFKRLDLRHRALDRLRLAPAARDRHLDPAVLQRLDRLQRAQPLPRGLDDLKAWVLAHRLPPGASAQRRCWDL